MPTSLQLRVQGSPALPTLVYLPGLHGDWTLVTSFREAVRDKVRFVDMTYPQTTTGSVADLAEDIEKALLARGITEGWLIGESFGSQPAWELIGRRLEADAGDPQGFKTLGLILAGGFVKHPLPWGARFLGWLTRRMPHRSLRGALAVYAGYAKFRHRHAPETFTVVREFVANRLAPGDRPALCHRYTLVADTDPRPIARRTRLPVYYLAGLIDPLVPFPFVRWWLRRNCPGYRGGEMFPAADHNVLGTAPRQCAEVVLRWMREAGNAFVAAPPDSPGPQVKPESERRLSRQP